MLAPIHVDRAYLVEPLAADDGEFLFRLEVNLHDVGASGNDGGWRWPAYTARFGIVIGDGLVGRLGCLALLVRRQVRDEESIKAARIILRAGTIGQPLTGDGLCRRRDIRCLGNLGEAQAAGHGDRLHDGIGVPGRCRMGAHRHLVARLQRGCGPASARQSAESRHLHFPLLGLPVPLHFHDEIDVRILPGEFLDRAFVDDGRLHVDTGIAMVGDGGRSDGQHRSQGKRTGSNLHELSPSMT